MKLRIKGNQALFEAALLLDDPECKQMGHRAVIRINGDDGEQIYASPPVAAQRCDLVWATSQEWKWLEEHGFLRDEAAEPDEQAS